LGLRRLSQRDKRVDYARNAAKFLIDAGITPFDLAKHFDNDAVRLRESLTNSDQYRMGYGSKKVNMFLRDMLVLGVWPEIQNFERVDVATDINVMKVALRMGILKTKMPLLSSMLDVFCYQYSHIDSMTALAWRRVWEKWVDEDASSAPKSPAIIDTLIYRIGREYCKDIAYVFVCQGDQEHSFARLLTRGARATNCPKCRQPLLVSRKLPCQLSSSVLPRDPLGGLSIDTRNLLYLFDGTCIFDAVCNPRDDEFRKLAPPKSISILGQTGWTTAYADEEEGGGGLMA